MSMAAVFERPVTASVRGVGRVWSAAAAFVAGRWEAAGRARARRRLALDPALARQLLAPVEVPTFPGVAPNMTNRFEQQVCQHCKGVHSRKCPAVAEIEYHTDGAVKRVSYFRHGQWPTDQVLWLEEVQEAAAFDGGEQR